MAKLVLVGGFLGAGKTTLLRAAARLAKQRGQRVGLISNDQAPDLVDTGWLLEVGVPVREIAGSCFCCNYDGLVDAVRELIEQESCDLVIAEPVGSCTDLSATILQPLKDGHGIQVELAPLSVLADPSRLLPVLSGGSDMHSSAAYIYRKQLEEADRLVLSKADLLEPAERDQTVALLQQHFPNRPVDQLSSHSGEGLSDWLQAVLAATVSGQRVVAVDYDTYADGEAALGWVNAEARLSGSEQWRERLQDLMHRLQQALRGHGAAVGHVKVLLTGDDGHLVGNLTRLDEEPSVRGDMAAANSVRCLINARVELPAAVLQELVERCCLELPDCDSEIVSMHAITPGRPVPVHRYEGPTIG
jgi:G3E family GTPase